MVSNHSEMISTTPLMTRVNDYVPKPQGVDERLNPQRDET
jgi:hypothetical protein